MDIPKKLTTDPPRWLFEDYEGMEIDIADDVLSAIYWNMRNQAEHRAKKKGEAVDFDSSESLNKARLLADAYMRSAIHASQLKDGVDRAFIKLVYQIKSNGFYYAQEFDTIQEWLIDKIPKLSEKSGELYDILFLVNHFFPMLERVKNGWQPKDLMKMSDNWARTRSTIPYLRGITEEVATLEMEYKTAIESVSSTMEKLTAKLDHVEENEKGEIKKELRKLKAEKEMLETSQEKEMSEAFKKVEKGFDRAMKLIQDNSIPAHGPNNISQILNQEKNEIMIFDGDMSIIQGYGGKERVFMFVLPEKYSATVEGLLRNLIKFQMTDGKVALESLQKLILPKGK